MFRRTVSHHSGEYAVASDQGDAREGRSDQQAEREDRGRQAVRGCSACPRAVSLDETSALVMEMTVYLYGRLSFAGRMTLM